MIINGRENGKEIKHKNSAALSQAIDAYQSHLIRDSLELCLSAILGHF